MVHFHTVFSGTLNCLSIKGYQQMKPIEATHMPIEATHMLINFLKVNNLVP